MSIDWQGILRVIGTTALMYVVIVVLVRLVGKRAASRMNNFDWIVTVVIGSIIGSTIILKDVTVVKGLSAVTTLFSAQVLITYATSHWNRAEKIVMASPRLVAYDGSYLPKCMEEERIARSEIEAAIRSAGLGAIEEVQAVVLEADAEMSVIPKSASTGPLLQDVAR